MNFQPIHVDNEALSQCTELMKICFPHAKIFNTEYMKWLYRDNPEGEVIGFNAWDGDRLVAHYACIPKCINIDGESVRAILSLNTATHLAYQGKGLFTKLATMTYEKAVSEGYNAVFGVANAHSTPGFVNKLGFQLVRQLEARLGFGQLNIDFESVKKNIQFEVVWSKETLSWRCANPNNQIFRRLLPQKKYLIYLPLI